MQGHGDLLSGRRDAAVAQGEEAGGRETLNTMSDVRLRCITSSPTLQPIARSSGNALPALGVPEPAAPP
ncbi:MAG: hypothetical protein E6J71_25890 [Deltaproteobacteria bacterium]|nr:MAG: hypothetical protein E6J71_25890 [Deltaproteobacteria bacterium]